MDDEPGSSSALILAVAEMLGGASSGGSSTLVGLQWSGTLRDRTEPDTWSKAGQ